LELTLLLENIAILHHSKRNNVFKNPYTIQYRIS
jgi:hypothetical protein